MKFTLLQIINHYADYTDGFRASTIDDTIESQQVASIAEKVFYDLNNDVFGNSQLESLIQLDALADSTKPNYLQLPDNAADIKHDAVMYDTSDDAAATCSDPSPRPSIIRLMGKVIPRANQSTPRRVMTKKITPAPRTTFRIV